MRYLSAQVVHRSREPVQQGRKVENEDLCTFRNEEEEGRGGDWMTSVLSHAERVLEVSAPFGGAHPVKPPILRLQVS